MRRFSYPLPHYDEELMKISLKTIIIYKYSISKYSITSRLILFVYLGFTGLS